MSISNKFSFLTKLLYYKLLAFLFLLGY